MVASKNADTEMCFFATLKSENSIDSLALRNQISKTPSSHTVSEINLIGTASLRPSSKTLIFLDRGNKSLLRRASSAFRKVVAVYSTLGRVATPDGDLCWMFCSGLLMNCTFLRLLIAHSWLTSRAVPWLVHFARRV